MENLMSKKLTKVTLSVQGKHKKGKYRLLKHMVTRTPTEFTLTEKEVELLSTPEYVRWVKNNLPKKEDENES